jgi:DNA-binding PucR family transcriptional regulator
VRPGLAGARVGIGVAAAPACAVGLHGALEEARAVRRLGEHRPGQVRVADSSELTSHGLLLATVPDELRRSFTDRLLGPLVAYDAAHRTDLLATLEAFLDCDGSWTRCAARLHLHVNTLRYRIGRIEHLTGRDLSTFPGRVDLYLALRLR